MTLHVILVEATDGNAYMLGCDSRSRWSKCRYLAVGQTFRARWKSNGLAVAYISEKNKTVEATYRVLKSAVMDDKGTIAKMDWGQVAPQGSPWPNEALLNSWWPQNGSEKPSPTGRGALGAKGRNADDGGVLVTETTPFGPADQAGVLVGDLIIAVDQKRIDSLQALGQEVSQRTPGSIVNLSLRRRDIVIVVTARIADSSLFP